MKILLSDIISNSNNLIALQNVKFPLLVSYKISRLVDKLNPDVTTFSEKKNALIKEIGEFNEETQEYTIKDPEKVKLFTGQIEELLKMEIEVDFEKIKIADCGNVEIEPKLLLPFIFE